MNKQGGDTKMSQGCLFSCERRDKSLFVPNDLSRRTPRTQPTFEGIDAQQGDREMCEGNSGNGTFFHINPTHVYNSATPNLFDRPPCMFSRQR